MTRVLVIDDNEDLRELLQVILTAEGYVVDLAVDGETGVVSQRAAPYDLVITDIFMPNQDGIETIGQLRREYPRLKIIAVSGGGKASHAQGYLRTALEIGADAVLSKPFEQEELVQTVRHALGTQEQSQ